MGRERTARAHAGRAVATLLAGVAVLGAACAYRLFQRRRATRDVLRAQAAVFIQEKLYKEAQRCLRALNSDDLDTLTAQALCAEALGNGFDALLLLNRAIAIEARPALVEARLRLHARLGMPRDAFSDLFLLSLLGGEKRFAGELAEALKAVSSYEALQASAEAPPAGVLGASPAAYADVLDTLLFLDECSDPVVPLLRSGEYDTCMELISGSALPLHTLVRACVFFAAGLLSQALTELADAALTDVEASESAAGSSTDGSNVSDGSARAEAEIAATARAFRLFIAARIYHQKSVTHGYCAASRCFAQAPDAPHGRSALMKSLAALESSHSATAHYYLARAYEALDDQDALQRHVERSLAIRAAPPALALQAVARVRQGERSAALALARSALERFPEHINLHCIVLECLVHAGLRKEAVAGLRRLETAGGTDPRVALFRYIVSRAVGAPDAAHLHAAIAADPRYFKARVYLANHLMGTSEAAVACRATLAAAHGFDELFTAYQLVVIVDTQAALARAHPGLL